MKRRNLLIMVFIAMASMQVACGKKPIPKSLKA